METFTLFSLNTYVKQVLALNFPDPLWVRCEINRVSHARGHAFLDLVEKAEHTDEILAQANAVCWRSTLSALRRKHGAALDSLLQDGMEVRLNIHVDFHERYGLKYTIQDVDPDYSLGRLEARRRQILEQVQKEGLLDRNAQRPLPPVIQRIAVLSAPHAAGWHDFQAHLQGHPAGFHFSLELFPTALQGEQVEKDLAAQLGRIQQRADDFDAVALIRGGGARLDLAAFDSLPLARRVANLPLPFLTGIGHEIDLTVLDRVAHHALRTPTAVADFLLEHNAAFDAALDELGRIVSQYGDQLLYQEKLQLDHANQRLQYACRQRLQQAAARIDLLSAPLPALGRQHLQNEKAQLDKLTDLLEQLKPETVLRRGFTLSLQQGRVLRSAEEATSGHRLVTRFWDGEISSDIVP